MLSILCPTRPDPYIHDLIQEVEKIGIAHEIIVVADQERHGKGWALREAFKQAKGDQIAFLDGDGDIEPRMLLRLLPFLADFDVVVGSKRITIASLQRRLITHLSRFYLQFFFGLKVDSQTGIKLFRRTALSLFSAYWKCDGYLFDVEILTTCQRHGLRIVEVPVEAEIKAGVSWISLCQTFWESLGLWYRLLFPAKK